MKISRRGFFNRHNRVLRTAVEKAIAAADPIKLLELGAPGDEYAPEVSTILSRLDDAATEDAVRTIVHDVFAQKFGAEIAGPAVKYEHAAATIWRVLNER